MASEEGRLLIHVEGVIQELDFTDSNECDEFLKHLNKTLYESWRQKLLGWRNNRHIKAQEDKINPPLPPPDHIRRERERTANRPTI